MFHHHGALVCALQARLNLAFVFSLSASWDYLLALLLRSAVLHFRRRLSKKDSFIGSAEAEGFLYLALALRAVILLLRKASERA